MARLLEGETMTALCVEFGISRKTGYKIFDRYKDYGIHGLTDCSRRAHRHAAVGRHDAERVVVCRLQRGVRLGNRRYCYPLTITDFASR